RAPGGERGATARRCSPRTRRLGVGPPQPGARVSPLRTALPTDHRALLGRTPARSRSVLSTPRAGDSRVPSDPSPRPRATRGAPSRGLGRRGGAEPLRGALSSDRGAGRGSRPRLGKNRGWAAAYAREILLHPLRWASQFGSASAVE